MAEALRSGQLNGRRGFEAGRPALFGLPRFAPILTLAVLLLPIACGLAGTILPAFGYLPALGGDRLTLHWFADLFGQPGLARSVGLSVASGLVTTGISLALVFHFVAGWSGTRVFRRLQHLLSPLLAVPHASAAFGLAFLIAPSGFLFRLVSPWATGFSQPPDLLIVGDPYGLAMIAGLVVKEVPFLLLVTLAALPQVRLRETERLARSLGYGRIAGFAYVLSPVLYPQVRLAVYAVLAYASSVVDVAIVLGPSLPPPLAVRLLAWMNDPQLSMRFLASAGALLQLAVTFTTLGLWLAGEGVVRRLVVSFRDRGVRFRRDGWLRRLTLALVTLSAGTVLAGLAVLALWSVAGLWQFPDALPSALTGRSWARALPRIVGPLETTLAVAALAALIAILLTIGCLEREVETGRPAGRGALLVIYMPLIVPQISFVFGLEALAVAAHAEARFATLVLVHLVFILPYVFLSLSDPWRAFDRRYEIAAAALGHARGAVFFRVRLPMLLRAILTALAVGFAVSIGQYLPTVLVGAGRLTTVTTEAVALAGGGNPRVIGVYAFLQAVPPFLGFVIASLLPALLFRNRRALGV
ncbi:MAG: ABC transporter permease [Pararhizobium sp.]